MIEVMDFETKEEFSIHSNGLKTFTRCGVIRKLFPNMQFPTPPPCHDLGVSSGVGETGLPCLFPNNCQEVFLQIKESQKNLRQRVA